MNFTRRRDFHWRRLHIILFGDIWCFYLEIDGIVALSLVDR